MGEFIYVEIIAPNQCANNCSNHGVCNNGTCACEVDWNGYDCSIRTLSSCEFSKKFLALCSGTTSCNFHGTCTVSVDGNACVCETGWTGAVCETGEELVKFH